MKTANSLPSDYSGTLNIVINDGNAYVASRSAMLLLTLATLPDEDIAVDAALHFWYSVFLPIEYQNQMAACTLPFIQHFLQPNQSSPYPLGEKSTLSLGDQFEWLVFFFMHYSSPSETGISMDGAQREYDRVRQAHSRRDYRDRIYARLKPSHRVASASYRQYGIVLPFGAANAHFNSPNSSLFTVDGKWGQTDFADPLEGWK